VNEGTHKAFLERLDKSKIAVAVVAFWFCSRGYKVLLPPMTKAEKRADWREHSDSGDMYVYKEGMGSQTIEVKRITQKFFGRSSWPFKQHFIVDSVSTFDGKERKPNAYVVLGDNMSCMAMLIVNDGDEKRWVKAAKMNKQTEELQSFYFANTDTVKFIKLEKL